MSDPFENIDNEVYLEKIKNFFYKYKFIIILIVTLFILSALHRTHKESFDSVLEIKGRDRIYFAKSKEALLESGSSMNPKNIAESEYWVMTNSNTTRKKMMLHEVALGLGYKESEAETIRDYL